MGSRCYSWEYGAVTKHTLEKYDSQIIVTHLPGYGNHVVGGACIRR